jgi:hypothetical protein
VDGPLLPRDLVERLERCLLALGHVGKQLHVRVPRYADVRCYGGCLECDELVVPRIDRIMSNDRIKSFFPG